jgi:carbon storage regulator
MLVLSRKTNERIVLGNDIVLTVTNISGNRVTIGIEAPNSVAILRGELLADIDAEASQQRTQARTIPQADCSLDCSLAK